jgi:hypothetical protein
MVFKDGQPFEEKTSSLVLYGKILDYWKRIFVIRKVNASPPG